MKTKEIIAKRLPAGPRDGLGNSDGLRTPPTLWHNVDIDQFFQVFDKLRSCWEFFIPKIFPLGLKFFENFSFEIFKNSHSVMEFGRKFCFSEVYLDGNEHWTIKWGLLHSLGVFWGYF